MVAPPIDAEMSDESDGEDGEYTRSKFVRHHPNILEEDEDVVDHHLHAAPEHPREGPTEILLPPSEDVD